MQIIGVRLKKAGRILFFEPNDEELAKDDWVLVDTSRGLECGKIVIAPREIPVDEKIESEPGVPIRKIYRKATEQDLIQLEENHADEKRAFEICRDKIAEHGLPMKLINVEFTFDVNKIIFFFTADGRVDFRELVRDLASVFRTRIELRQVGVRDEAKLLGGMGGCGRPLCCASFLGDFIPVSIRMAKEQNLSLNPTKISGVCGRLMCCLKYENDLYCDSCPNQPSVTFKPKQGSRVVVADGEGKVVAVSYSRRNATILLDTNKTVVAGWEDILPVNAEDFDSAEDAAQPEEINPIEPAPKPEHPERPPRSERPRRSESFIRRYSRTENSERTARPERTERPERPMRPRGDRTRRQPRRDPKK